MGRPLVRESDMIADAESKAKEHTLTLPTNAAHFINPPARTPTKGRSVLNQLRTANKFLERLNYFLQRPARPLLKSDDADEYCRVMKGRNDLTRDLYWVQTKLDGLPSQFRNVQKVGEQMQQKAEAARMARILENAKAVTAPTETETETETAAPATPTTLHHFSLLPVELKLQIFELLAQPPPCERFYQSAFDLRGCPIDIDESLPDARVIPFEKLPARELMPDNGLWTACRLSREVMARAYTRWADAMAADPHCNHKQGGDDDDDGKGTNLHREFYHSMAEFNGDVRGAQTYVLGIDGPDKQGPTYRDIKSVDMLRKERILLYRAREAYKEI